MSRPPRIDVPGYPQHLIARGNNRTAFFFKNADRRIFLKYLRQAASACDCDVHAFVLMTNHVHLLATGNVEGAISRMMQSLGRRYARYVNRVYGRTGTLFEGRFKSSLIESDRYFLACMRYIELNPVRAGMASSPADYNWSSFRENAGGQPSGWLRPHSEYRQLGANTQDRGKAYRALFQENLDATDLSAIRRHVQKNRALGSETFRKRLEAMLNRPVGIVRPGNPGKGKSNLTPFGK